LFDLSDDVGEQNNLLNSNEELATQLEQAWQLWNSQMADVSAVSIHNEWP
jgi:hypothetical protein